MFFGSPKGVTKDIIPSYVTLTDGSKNSYTLTKSLAKSVTSSEAIILINKNDLYELQKFVDNNGFSTKAGNLYRIEVTNGWNGPYSVGDMDSLLDTESGIIENAVEVTGYTPPEITLSSAIIDYGKSVSVCPTKLGYVYLIPEYIDLESINTKLKLDKLYDKSMVPIKNIGQILIPTKTLTLTSPTYKAVAVDLAGVLSIASQDLITINTPALNAKVSAGSIFGTTNISITGLGTGNTFAYYVSKEPLLTPSIASTPPEGYINCATSNFTVVGVDPIDYKYLGLYELNSDGKIVKFKQLILTSRQISKVVS